MNSRVRDFVEYALYVTVQYRAYTTYPLQTAGILFYHYALIVLNTSQSQGGGRTTAMLPSLLPDLLACPSCPPPLPGRLSFPLCFFRRPPVSAPCPPPLPSSARPSISSSPSPTYPPCPALCCCAARVGRSHYVPPGPAYCCTVDNGKEEE